MKDITWTLKTIINESQDMVSKFQNLEESYQDKMFSVSVPITQAAFQTARLFARQSPNKAISSQIYRNTLTTYVVHNYLTMLGIATDLSKSSNWHPVMRLIFNSAALKIPGHGYLECCPVSKNESLCHLPADAPSNCIGYVVVELDEENYAAQLLGFVADCAEQSICLNKLDSISILLENLSQQKDVIAYWRRRLDEIFSDEWQSAEGLLSRRQIPMAGLSGKRVRNKRLLTEEKDLSNRIQRAKLINWEKSSNNIPVVLLIDCKIEAEYFDARLQIFQATSRVLNSSCGSIDLETLPPNLKLKLLDFKGDFIKESLSRSDFLDDYIQVSNRFPVGESFGYQISLNGEDVFEHFDI